MKNQLYLILLILLVQQLNQKIIDRSSYADINKVKTNHLNLSLEVDFENKQVFGHVILNMQRLKNVSYVDLDMIGLTIQSIHQYANKKEFELKYNIDTPHELLGSRLRIFIIQSDFQQINDSLCLNIHYKTLNNPSQRSINWLEPSQTSGKVLPYMFTQCESINCRSLIPLQDTPSSKFTYTATIFADSRFNVQMSAYPQTKRSLSNNKTMYFFNQPIPVPSYLIALAVGDFQYQKIGKRTGVIAEKEQLEQAVECFGDLDIYLDKAEEVFGNYSWGNYTILVLPPSFPFGGMENPFMTFASPTVITKDKQQVFVAIHEIMHSWFGNQVTMRNWTDFWLNEGFTVFAERTVSGLIFGEDFRKIQSQIGLVGLTADETGFGMNNSYSSLTPQLGYDNPDNAFSEVPYEKGYFFLQYLSSVIGNENMIKFLNIYTVTFKFQSIGVQDFLDLFERYCATEGFDISEVNWDQWIKSPGLPPILPNMTTLIYEDAMELAKQYLQKQDKINTELFKSFFSSVKVLFLNKILDNYNQVDDILNIVQRIDNDYQIGSNNDPEIKCAWQQLAVKSLYLSDQSQTLEFVDKFMSSQGRMKYLKPIYKALMDTANLKYIKFAQDMFEKNKSFYHPLAVQQIQSIVYPNKKKSKKELLIIY